MFAQRLAQVSVSATLKVAAEAERLRREGYDVVDFSAGEPDFPTPEHVKEAGKAAIDANFTRYTPAPGIPELRQAICARYAQDYGVDITPAEVLITVGGKQALFNAAMALFDPDDEVISLGVASQGEEMISVTEQGYGKRSKLADYPPKGRGGKGVIGHQLTKKTGLLAGAYIGSRDIDMFVISSSGQVVRVPAGDIRRVGRASQGVRTMRVEEGATVVRVGRAIFGARS